MSRFDICLPYILKEEGGNDDNPHDPGGRTSRGIIQTEYDAYRRRRNEELRDVWLAGDDEVADIYRVQYWLPWAAEMSPGVDLVYFDMAVNSGPYRAAVLLQRALGVADDGHIGLITLGALGKANPIKLISNFSAQRAAFYRGLKTYKYFGRGWLSRVNTIEKVAFAMAAGTLSQ